MVNVCIQKDLFPAGESLFHILSFRMPQLAGARARRLSLRQAMTKPRQTHNSLMHFCAVARLPKSTGECRLS